MLHTSAPPIPGRPGEPRATNRMQAAGTAGAAEGPVDHPTARADRVRDVSIGVVRPRPLPCPACPPRGARYGAGPERELARLWRLGHVRGVVRDSVPPTLAEHSSARVSRCPVSSSSWSVSTRRAPSRRCVRSRALMTHPTSFRARYAAQFICGGRHGQHDAVVPSIG